MTRVAVSIIFLIHGLIVAAWISRIPAIQEALDLSASRLGFTLAFLGIGSLVAMPVSGLAIDRWGSRPITLLATASFCFALGLAGFVTDARVLAALNLFLGGSAGAMDVAMNAQAVEAEERARRPLMSGFHAMFSLGGILGSGLGGLLVSAGVGGRAHLAVTGLALFAVGMVVSRWLIDAPPHPHAHQAGLRLNRRVLTLGAIGFCFFLNEGALADWTGIYLRDVANAGPAWAASGYAAFSAGMTVMRFAGDAVTARLGPVATVRLGALTGAAGVALALLVPATVPVLVGVAVAGLGFAVIIPLVFSASGRIEGMAPGSSVASVTTAGYFGFLTGPAILGFLADALTLRTALGLVVVLSLAGASLARAVAVKKVS